MGSAPCECTYTLLRPSAVSPLNLQTSSPHGYTPRPSCRVVVFLRSTRFIHGSSDPWASRHQNVGVSLVASHPARTSLSSSAALPGLTFFHLWRPYPFLAILPYHCAPSEFCPFGFSSYPLQYSHFARHPSVLTRLLYSDSVLWALYCRPPSLTLKPSFDS